ncbi:MAG TPA: DUF2608 domain-containing protein [Candidatus Babeliales bacterium]|nr:DUF2608 domain-containing protein [Candidatus Babeliales bacterium]
MKKFIFSILFIVCVAILPKSQIIETNNLEDILGHVTKNSVVLFDLDNTLVQPKNTYVGSDPWFTELFKKEKDVNLALADYCLGLILVELQPVANNTIKVLNKIKKSGVPTIGFTARNFYISSITIEYLKDIGITFNGPGIPKHKFVYYSHKDHPSIYQDGIFFCGPNEKEAVVPFFIKEFPQKPNKIVFVDDKLKNLETVKKIVDKMGLDFVGFRYGACDEYTKKFDSKKTTKEFERLKKNRRKKLKR